MKKHLLLLWLMLSIVACVKEIPTELSVSPTSISFESKGSSESIVISTNKAWSASSSAQWCTVSPLSGQEGETSISVSTKPNEEFESRLCEVTIVSAEITKTISITQASKEGVVISQNVFNISKESQNVEVDIQSNTSFQVIPEVDWIKYQNTKGLSSSKVVLRVQANDTYNKRSGVVKFVSNNSTTSITINQDVNYGIEVTPSSVVITKDEQSFDVNVKANVDYDIIISDAAKNWLSVLQTKSLSEKVITFRAARNTSGNIRETSITLKQQNGDLKRVISVTQTSEEAVAEEDQYGNIRLIFNGMYYAISSTEDLTVRLLKPNGTCPTEVVIPKYIAYKGKQLSVESIAGEAFKKQTSLKKITFPSTLKSIGIGAFAGCTALSNLIFEDSQEPIQLTYQKYESSPGYYGPGQSLFYDCPLVDIYLGRNVEYKESWYAEYGYSPFYGKKSLTTFICSSHVTRFGKYFISGSTSLSTLVLSDNITSMGGHALSSCGVLEITLPSRLSQMEHSVLSGSAIKIVNVPAALKKLPDYTFNSCKNLEEIHLYGLEEIVSSAFDQCKKIKRLYCYTTTPPKFVKRDASEIRSFETTVYSEGTLYVPNESIEQYKNAEHWKKFWSIKPLP